VLFLAYAAKVPVACIGMAFYGNMGT
jgi:hypothetical protein